MIEILKSVPFFRDLKDEELQAIAGGVTMEYYPAGYTLFREGDAGEKMYLIKSGSVEVVRGGAILATLPAGQFFGEMALVSDEPRNATVKAAADVELLVVHKSDFRKLIETYPSIASQVSYEVVQRSNRNAG